MKIELLGYVLCVCIVCFLYVGFLFEGSVESKIVVCDVGQGSAMLLISGKVQVLFDVSANRYFVLDCLGKYMPIFDKTIEMVVVSHLDMDHVGGMRGLSEIYEIEKIVCNCEKRDLGLVEYGFVDVLQMYTNDSMVLKDVQIKSLSPSFAGFRNCLMLENCNKNDMSMVLEVMFSGGRILVPGDAEANVLSGLMIGEVYIVLVPHHGSAGGLTSDLIESMNPEYGVVSVGGENKFGHPDAGVLEILEVGGVEVFRTDLHGDVVFDL